MRVLHVDKFVRRFGGAAGYMLDVAQLQRDSGDTVEFFGMAHPDNLPTKYNADFPPFVQLEPLPSGVGQRVATAASMVWSRQAGQAMARVVDDFQPDIVHVHNIYHQLSPSILRPLAKRGIPVVMTAHDYKMVCPNYRLLDQNGPCQVCVEGSVIQAVTRRCQGGSLSASALLALETGVHRTLRSYGPISRFIAPSEFLAHLLRTGLRWPDRVRQLANFVEIPGPARTDSGNANSFVFAGRLSKEKGVDTAILGVARVPGAMLTIVGDGPERQNLERLAAQEAPGRVKFLGHVPKSAVLDELRHARAAVLTARWHENMPLSVLETMALGVPMITSGLGGLPELVTHESTGLVVAHDDPEALANAMVRLRDDDGLVHRLGVAGRAKVIAGHDPAKHLVTLREIYREAATAA